jgi:hypothetical protein
MGKKPKNSNPKQPAPSDLTLTPDDATQVKGGAPRKADGSFDAGVHSKVTVEYKPQDRTGRP